MSRFNKGDRVVYVGDESAHKWNPNCGKHGTVDWHPLDDGYAERTGETKVTFDDGEKAWLYANDVIEVEQ